ncbi:hypothetical protein DSL64_21450 [Dyadobacter luteus]|uniref:DUF3078 domain-containing protein n=1 Tax=Dyadobacter luteus TaxID=2259619 RepID=A0A3D8Y680_9BACT|nr:hypothetical protein [Dyadobacter luteus]REA58176.1 hypothetical protein DSL64_21450 [Dyadobacter luteus]
MKKLLLFIASLCPFVSSAQAFEDLSWDYRKKIEFNKDTMPLTPKAFNRFLINHYNYTLLGSSTPSTGIKVETDKPSISLKGNIWSSKDREWIVNMELRAGLDNGVMQVVSGDKVNTLFKANFGINKLWGNNSAWYTSQNKYVLRALHNDAVIKYSSLKEYIDTAKVLSALIDKTLFNTPTVSKLDTLLFFKQQQEIKFINDRTSFLKKEITELESSAKPKECDKEKINKKKSEIKQIILRLNDIEYTINNKRRIVLDALREFDIPGDALSDSMLVHYVKIWTTSDTMLLEKKSFINKNNKYNIIADGAVDSLFKYEIEAVAHMWNSKTIKWFNLSPFVSNVNFVHYQPDSVRLTDKSSFLWGVKFSGNMLIKWKEPNRFFYWSAGLVGQRVNSLEEMTDYSYKKSVQKKITETETISDEKTGTAYEGLLSTGWGVSIPIEIFYVPWKQAYIPGFYLNIEGRWGEKWINDKKLSLAAGIIWNVTNGDKDAKNVLTIIPYAKFSNVVKEYTDVAKQNKKALHDLFSAGVQVGIPINLGK